MNLDGSGGFAMRTVPGMQWHRSIVLLLSTCCAYCGDTQLVREVSFPSSVVHRVADGTHLYTIVGVYTDSISTSVPRDTWVTLARADFARHWTNLALDIDFRGNRLTIRSSSPIQTPRLRDICNRQAKQGLFPYWDDLVNRDRKSAFYNQGLFRWEAAGRTYCVNSTWVVDVDGDGLDDFVLLQNNHGDCSVFIYQQSAERR